MTTVNSVGGPAAADNATRSSGWLRNRRRVHTTFPRSSVKVATCTARTARSIPNVIIIILLGRFGEVDPKGQPAKRDPNIRANRAPKIIGPEFLNRATTLTEPPCPTRPS